MSYRPDRRDPLTERTARQVRDTIADPWAYSEGSSEPQYLVVDEPEHQVDRLLRRWGLLLAFVVVALIATGVL